MLAAVLAQLAAEAEAGRAALSDWRCQQLDELAVKLSRTSESEADAALVATLVCGANSDSLLSEGALHSVLERALEVLEPSWRDASERGALTAPNRGALLLPRCDSY